MSFELPELDLKGKPPAFGHAMLNYFCFEKDYVNLNHGSYGSLPAPVFDFCTRVARNIEANPDIFMRVHLLNVLRGLRERIAPVVGAHADDVVFVPNASHGINTVLRNFEWHPQDILVGTTTTYDAVESVVRYLHDIPPHPSVSTFTLEFPTTRAEIIANFRKYIRGLRAELAVRQKKLAGDTKLKIVAVIDALVSNPGVHLPWQEMSQICREEGVWSVIDAAHAIGQETDINLSKADPDFWVANCHKWMYAKRGCAILYVPKRNQHIIKSPIPTPATYRSPNNSEPSNFLEMFGWTGTVDHTPYISIHAALDFRAWLGGEHKINAYCRSLALQGGRRLAEILGTYPIDRSATGELTLNMCNVALPLSSQVPDTPMNRTIINYRLLNDARVSVSVFVHNTVWWVRCSAQVWNELSDFDHLGEALLSVCKDLEDDNHSSESRVVSKL